MGSGKGQTKRTSATTSPKRSTLANAWKSINFSGIEVCDQDWHRWLDEEGLTNRTFVKHYHRNIKNEKQPTDEDVSFLLTETLHDIIENNMFSVSHANLKEKKQIVKLAKPLNYSDYEIKYTKDKPMNLKDIYGRPGVFNRPVVELIDTTNGEVLEEMILSGYQATANISGGMRDKMSSEKLNSYTPYYVAAWLVNTYLRGIK